MEKEKKVLSEAGRINKSYYLCYVIEIAVIFIAYLLEVVKGSRTIGYFMLIAALIVLPGVALGVMIKKNPEARLFRTLAIPAFGILYAVIIFTTVSPLAFTYAMPLLLAITMYNSVQLSLLTGATVIVLNIAQVIYRFVSLGKGNFTSADAEIQVLILVFVCAYSIVANRVAARTAKDNMDELEAEKDNTAKNLEHTMFVANVISKGITKVCDKMNELDASVTNTLGAMEEVSQGSTETAESVQSELIKTEEIQTHISDVENAANEIEENINRTKNAIHTGSTNLSELIEQVKQSEKSGEDAMVELQALNEYTEQMHTIIELINNVAEQTSLLSLNASIEAARAGEAGKGFAVVASEISSLAAQTQDATENIESLIGSISSKIESVVEAINGLVSITKKQTESAGETVGSFTHIEKNADYISESSKLLNEIVSKLAVANASIVESIQNVSAITEEVSAHANETYTISEKNKDIVEQVSNIVSSLNDQALDLTKN